jgi:hypothetical protein
MKSLITLTTILLSISGSLAQLHCGTDEMHQTLWQTRLDLQAGAIRADQELQDFTHDFQNNQVKSAALYVICVVFHIIHNNGIENISDAQVHDTLGQLNIQIRKLNADTFEINPAFQAA